MANPNINVPQSNDADSREINSPSEQENIPPLESLPGTGTSSSDVSSQSSPVFTTPVVSPDDLSTDSSSNDHSPLTPRDINTPSTPVNSPTDHGSISPENLSSTGIATLNLPSISPLMLPSMPPEYQTNASTGTPLPYVSNTGTGLAPVGLSLPDMPPPYEVLEIPLNAEASNINPPSYEEVQQQKALEAGIGYSIPANVPIESNPSGVQVLHVSSLGGQIAQSEVLDENILGTDLMFLAAFTGTFVFNWVALILFLCFCNTIACRSGALAGFGFSTVIAMIFRYPHTLNHRNDRNGWLIWVILILGLLISVRAILQYAAAKRKFHLMHQNRQSGFSLVC